MPLQNNWVGYVDRSFEQIKENVLTKFQNLVPEITDHTESNTWVKGISIWSGIAEMLGYYLDNRAREAFLSTALKFESGVKIARLFGYRIKGAVPASVDLTFTTDVPATAIITIPEGTLCRTAQGVEFRTTEEGVINIGEDNVQVTAKQWTPVIASNLGTSDGSPDQVFELIPDVVDSSISVTVGGMNYEPVDTFAYSVPDSEVFVGGLNESTNMAITFGDDMAGMIPPSAQDVVATYFTSLGADGTVGANTITEIVDSITLPPSTEISVNNLQNAGGGADPEDLDRLRKTIPLSLRTKDRAVTPQDFIDIAQLVPGVAKAGQEFDCGKFVDVYIAPTGGGFPSNQLLEDVENFFDDRETVLVNVRALGAGEIVIQIRANIRALANYANTDVQTRVQDNLIAFLSVENQDINGVVFLSDIYEVIETTEGVDNSDVLLFSPIPFARPLEATTTILDWDRAITEASVSTIKWNIRFTNATTYELKKEGSFIGSFATDVQVVQDEIVFTINSNYAANDEYEFVTYSFNDRKIQLDEPSIPVTNSLALDLTVTGGIQ